MASQDQRISGQENAFRKVALKKGFLTRRDLERAQKERARLVARGVNMAIYQVLLRMGLLDIESVKVVLREIKNHYFFCSRCGRENPRKKDGAAEGAPPGACRYCEAEKSPSVRAEASTVVSDPWIGQRLGAFEMLELLGEGGSGKVYKARQTPLDRLVAVKVLYPWLAIEEDRAKRFLREAKAMARIEHPHVVPIYDYGREQRCYYLVMAYMPGQDLGRLLAERGRLPVPEALAILAQALEGLGALHDAGVIHRDLKPDNIMITGSGRAMVMDLGLAREIQPSDTLTQSEQILGTPYYMSPEQCLNRDVDARTDLYSLGVTFYQMLTGLRPFGGENAVELIMGHLFERPVEPHLVCSAIDRNVSAVACMLMAKDKRNRYANAQAALEDVRRLQAGERPLARPRARLLLSRRWRRVTAAATAAGLLLTGWMLFGGRAERAGETAPQPPSPVVSPVTQGRALELFDQAVEFEKRQARRYPGGQAKLGWLVARRLERIEELERFNEELTSCFERFRLPVERYERTEAAKDARAEQRRLFALTRQVADRITRLQAARQVRLLAVERAERSASRTYRALTRRIGALLGRQAYGRARGVLADPESPVRPATALWLAHLRSEIERHETAAVRQRLQQAGQAERAGRPEEARRALLAWPEPERLPQRLLDELRAIEARLDRRRREAERARVRLRLRREWPRVRDRLRRLLGEGRPGEAADELRDFVEFHPDTRRHLGSELAGFEQDVTRLRRLWQAAERALGARVGQHQRLLWRDGAPASRGVLRQSEGHGPFRLFHQGQLVKAFRLKELHVDSILRLGAPVAALDEGTARLYSGDLTRARASLERAPRGAEAARLLVLVTAELLAQGRATAGRLLDAGKLREAHRQLRALDLLAPAEQQGQESLYQRLGRLAEPRYLLVARELYQVRQAGIEEPIARWSSPRADRLRRDGRTLLLEGLPTADVLAAGGTTLLPPYRLRTALRLEPGRGAGGGLALGHDPRTGEFLVLQLDPRRRYRIWRYLPAQDRELVLRPWQTLAPGSVEQIELELLVLADRLVLRIGGRGLPDFPIRGLAGSLGLYAGKGSLVRLYPLRYDLLQQVTVR